MQNQETRILSGVPVGTPGYTPGPRYSIRSCQSCDMKLHLGPIGTAMIDSGEESTILCPVCSACLVRDSGPDAALRVQRLTDGETGSKFDEDEFNDYLNSEEN